MSLETLFQGSPGMLQLGTVAVPALAGVVPAGIPPILALTAAPGHPSNVVAVPCRVDGGPIRVVRAAPTAPSSGGLQTFVARLPALGPGQRLDYRAELLRVGQLIDSAPADGVWQSV